MTLIKKTQVILIGIWMIFAFFNVAYNGVKFFREERSWFSLTTEEKKHKLFGDLYSFFVLIDRHTPTDAHIAILSDDPRTFYLGAYFTYPRTLVVVSNKETFKKTLQRNNYSYAALYNQSLSLENFENIASISSNINFGTLYKK